MHAGQKGIVDETAGRTVAQAPSLGMRSAAELRRDTRRREAAERLRPPADGRAGLDRLAGLAARLLGPRSAQVSLLTGVQVVAGGRGSAAGTRSAPRAGSTTPSAA